MQPPEKPRVVEIPKKKGGISCSASPVSLSPPALFRNNPTFHLTTPNLEPREWIPGGFQVAGSCRKTSLEQSKVSRGSRESHRSHELSKFSTPDLHPRHGKESFASSGTKSSSSRHQKPHETAAFFFFCFFFESKDLKRLKSQVRTYSGFVLGSESLVLRTKKPPSF